MNEAQANVVIALLKDIKAIASVCSTVVSQNVDIKEELRSIRNVIEELKEEVLKLHDQIQELGEDVSITASHGERIGDMLLDMDLGQQKPTR